MGRSTVEADRKLNAVILLLTGISFLVAMALMYVEGIWIGVAMLGILLVVILAAAISTRV